MGAVVRVVALSIIAGVGAVLAVLAGISGVIGAVAWGCHRFGTVPVLILGAFVAGAIVMRAVDQGMAEVQRQSGDRGASVASASRQHETAP